VGHFSKALKGFGPISVSGRTKMRRAQICGRVHQDPFHASLQFVM
jgi:hypothetical protein